MKEIVDFITVDCITLIRASRIFNQAEELVKSDNEVEILHFAA